MWRMRAIRVVNAYKETEEEAASVLEDDYAIAGSGVESNRASLPYPPRIFR